MIKRELHKSMQEINSYQSRDKFRVEEDDRKICQQLWILARILDWFPYWFAHFPHTPAEPKGNKTQDVLATSNPRISRENNDIKL
jgi:hypothetical protein